MPVSSRCGSEELVPAALPLLQEVAVPLVYRRKIYPSFRGDYALPRKEAPSYLRFSRSRMPEVPAARSTWRHVGSPWGTSEYLSRSGEAEAARARECAGSV